MIKSTNPIAAKRKEKGLTQAQLAEKIGVNQAHISRWEKNAHKPTTAALIKLAAALDCSIEELI